MRDVADMPRAQVTSPSYRTYRPETIERPSLRQFVVLSVLGHILMIVLLGDDTGVRRDGQSWGSRTTFLASMDPRPPPPSPSPLATLQNLSRPPKIGAATTSPAPVALSAISEASQSPVPDAPTIIAPLAVIAVEVERPRSQFVVPKQDVELSTLVVAPQVPVIAAGPKPDEPLQALIGVVAIPVKPVDLPPPVDAPVVAPTRPQIIAPATPVLQSAIDHKAIILPSPALPALSNLSDVVSRKPEPLPFVVAEKQPLVPVEVKPAAHQNLPIPTATPPTPVAQSATEIQRESSAAPSVVDPRLVSDAIVGKRNESGQAATQAAERRSSSLLPVVPVLPVAPPAAVGQKLDLDNLRSRARQLAAEGAESRRMLPFPTVAKEIPKRDIEKIFDKALKRPDCKDEYANMGLAAIAPLVRDAIKGDGCKW